MPSAPYFSPRLFTFLKDLKANNERDWFNANKPRYEKEVKEAAVRFISDFAPHLAKISPHFRADPRPVGGSLFRIYRDTRFSKDKTPYKTHVGIHFRHELAKTAHAPGFYLHLEPGSAFLGAGIWKPEPKVAQLIREAIVEDPDRWKRLLKRKAFRESFELAGDSLKRPPKGVDADHPLMDDLKRKDFMAVSDLTQKSATSRDFMKEFAANCRGVAPLVEYICDALGVPF